jgi:hypothetical protein
MVEKAAVPAKGKGIFYQSITKTGLKFCEYAEGETRNAKRKTQNAERYNPFGYPRLQRHLLEISEVKAVERELRSALSIKRSAL